jgi:hypothetical protein
MAFYDRCLTASLDWKSLINTLLKDSVGLEYGIILQPRAMAVWDETDTPFPNKVYSARS